MLNGFANENMSQNRFMARTRQLNSNFSNAIGTKEITPLPDKWANQKPVPTIYANAYGNPVQKATRPLVYNPYANAIGSKTSTVLINPVGYVPYKCGSNNSCGQGHRCITNGTNVATGEVANWCVPFAEWERLIRQRAFDGGFANAYGNPVVKGSRPLVYNPYKNASGDCGCGCSDNGMLGL